MAKTLKERAIELMNTLPVDEPKSLVYEAYKKSAIDQRKINIEKACDWIEENLFTVNENGEYKYVAKNIYGSPYI